MGSQPTPALGFAMGVERLLMALENQGAEMPEPTKCDLYIAPMGEKAALESAAICEQLRDEGFEALYDIVGRGLKAQMRYANKIGALYTIVLGDTELEEGKARLKCMETGEETEIELRNIVEAMYDARLSQITESFNI